MRNDIGVQTKNNFNSLNYKLTSINNNKIILVNLNGKSHLGNILVLIKMMMTIKPKMN